MERMDGDEEDVVVAINEFDHLLLFAVDGGMHESAKASDTMIDVDNIVAYLQLVQLFKGDEHFALTGSIGLLSDFVEALEELVVGEATELQIAIDKTGMERLADARETPMEQGLVGQIGDFLGKNGLQPVDLLL